jgi:hypothetical protein
VNEANTQSHLFNLAQSGARAPNVPEVYDVFNDGAGGTYLVTEQIPFPSFRAWVDQKDLTDEEHGVRTAIADGKIATAVALLLECPLPDNDMIGPVGGGRIQHFFGMEEAAIPFVNSSALGNFVNKVRFYYSQLYASLGWFVVTGIKSSPRGD